MSCSCCWNAFWVHYQQDDSCKLLAEVASAYFQDILQWIFQLFFDKHCSCIIPWSVKSISSLYVLLKLSFCMMFKTTINLCKIGYWNVKYSFSWLRSLFKKLSCSVIDNVCFFSHVKELQLALFRNKKKKLSAKRVWKQNADRFYNAEKFNFPWHRKIIGSAASFQLLSFISLMGFRYLCC